MGDTDGNGTADVFIDNGFLDRVLTVESGAAATLMDLNLVQGYDTGLVG